MAYLGAVRFFEVSHTHFIIFLGKGIRGFLRNNHVKAVLVCIGGSVSATHMRVKSCDDASINAEVFEQDVEVCSEKAAVMSFRNDKILVGNFKLGNNLCSFCSRDGVISPKRLLYDSRLRK